MKNDEVLNIWLFFDTVKLRYTNKLRNMLCIRIWNTHISGNRKNHTNLKCKEFKFKR